MIIHFIIYFSSMLNELFNAKVFDAIMLKYMKRTGKHSRMNNVGDPKGNFDCLD